MPSSWVNTECSIHRVQHTPSAAYTEYSKHQVQHTPKIVSRPFILSNWSGPWNVASASGVPPYRSTATSQFSIWGSKVKSPPHIPTLSSYLPDEYSHSTRRASHRLPADRPPPSTPTISLNHSVLQVHQQTRLITASECISEFTQSRSPIPYLNSLDHGLQMHLWVHFISVSKCISKLARSWPPSASQNLIDHGLQVNHWVHSISASKCMSKLARSRPPSASLSSRNRDLQWHLQTRSITASECMSEFTWSSFSGAPLIALKHPLQPVQIYCV